MTELNKVVVDCEGVPNGGSMNHESVHSLLHTIELAYLDKLREVVVPEWGAGADLVVEAEAVLNGVRDILEGRAIT